MTQKECDVLIIGAGPAGIFAAMELLKHDSALKVVVCDSGRDIRSRVCPARTTGKCAHCKPCAIMHGWSGAGAFSDGKLSLSPEVGGQIGSYIGEDKARELIKYADDIYLSFGAGTQVHGLDDKEVERISYEASRHDIHLVRCPVRHLGTEHAYEVLMAMYDGLAANANFEFLPLCAAQNIIVRDGEAQGAVVLQGTEQMEIHAGHTIVCPGRAGAAWLTRQAGQLGIKTINNAVDIGVRVETPNAVMDHLTRSLYEAKLVYYSDTFENKVRTFCMNPGGNVSEEYYEGGLAVVNGHSYEDMSLRSENTNFAMLVSTSFTEPFNEPIEYGRYIARLGNMLTGGGVMVQRLGDLRQGRRTTAMRLEKSTVRPTLKTAVPGDLSFVLPHRHLTSILEALEAFDKIAPGLNSRNTLLYGVEVKFYSSKLTVDAHMRTPIKGLYAAGDGAGITRGLMQASVTGIVAARDILGAEL